MQEAPAALVEAAMLLLQDSTLAGPCSVPSEEEAKQAVPQRDWEAFVQNQLQAKGSVAASSKLLAMRNAVPSPSARMVFASQVSLSSVCHSIASPMHSGQSQHCVSLHSLS